MGEHDWKYPELRDNNVFSYKQKFGNLTFTMLLIHLMKLPVASVTLAETLCRSPVAESP